MQQLSDSADFFGGAWAAAYPGEPFLEGDSGVDAGALVLDDFDVAAACERQRTFLWQVSGARRGLFPARWGKTLRELFSGSCAAANSSCPPTRSTSSGTRTSWRASHLRGRHAAAVGFELPHDDSVNDRAEGSKLNRQYEVTQKLG